MHVELQHDAAPLLLADKMSKISRCPQPCMAAPSDDDGDAAAEADRRRTPCFKTCTAFASQPKSVGGVTVRVNSKRDHLTHTCTSVASIGLLPILSNTINVHMGTRNIIEQTLRLARLQEPLSLSRDHRETSHHLGRKGLCFLLRSEASAAWRRSRSHAAAAASSASASAPPLPAPSGLGSRS